MSEPYPCFKARPERKAWPDIDEYDEPTSLFGRRCSGRGVNEKLLRNLSSCPAASVKLRLPNPLRRAAALSADAAACETPFWTSELNIVSDQANIPQFPVRKLTEGSPDFSEVRNSVAATMYRSANCSRIATRK
jgi:hypothetical protein